MKKETQNTITTIAVSAKDNQRLSAFCKQHGFAKKDFIGLVLDHYDSNGTHPKSKDLPRTELEKITKRLDQFFAFFKTQERDFIRPALEAIVATDSKVQNQIGTLASKRDLILFSTKDNDVKIAEAILTEIHKLKDSVLNLNHQLENSQKSISEDLNVLKNRKGISF